jgi:hypothetical protein
MRAERSKCSGRQRDRLASMPANQRMPASRCPQGPASIAYCSAPDGFAVAQAVQRRDPGLEPPGIWRMSVEYMLSTLRDETLDRAAYCHRRLSSIDVAAREGPLIVEIVQFADLPDDPGEAK